MTKEELIKECWKVFTTGNFIGEYGEELAISKLNLTAAPTGTHGYDAIDKNNNRVQIKVRNRKRIGLDGIHLDDGFDYIIVVVHNRKDFIGYIKITSEEFFKEAGPKKKDDAKSGYKWVLKKERINNGLKNW